MQIPEVFPTMKSLDAPKAPVKSKKEKVTEDDDDLKAASDQELDDFINKNVWIFNIVYGC